MFLLASAVERRSEGLLAALPRADLSLLACGAVVFGVQKLLLPPQDNAWLRRDLVLPNWMPPNYVFPLVWIPLKILQSVAAWLVWHSAKGNDLILPLAVFGVHLGLGNLWNLVFFNRKQLTQSLRVMDAFWLSVAGTATAFYAVNPLAGLLMLPTQVWVTVAAWLNYDIVRLNKSDKDQ